MDTLLPDSSIRGSDVFIRVKKHETSHFWIQVLEKNVGMRQHFSLSENQILFYKKYTSFVKNTQVLLK